MRLLRCPICKTQREVVKYRKDDPVLLCGHVITIDLQIQLDNRELKEDIKQLLTEAIYDTMKEENVSYKRAKEMIWVSQ